MLTKCNHLETPNRQLLYYSLGTLTLFSSIIRAYLATRIDYDSRANRWERFQTHKKNETFHSRNVSFTNLTMTTESAKSVFHTDSTSPYTLDIFIEILPPSALCLTLIHNTGPSPLDPGTWPPPPEQHSYHRRSTYLAELRPAALSTSTTSLLCLVVLP
jgi:hypothetical protein